MKKKTFLITTAIDNKYSLLLNKKKFNKFYLGKFCISDDLEFNEFNKKNCLNSNWKYRNKNILEYKYLKKVTLSLFKVIAKKLNKIHKVKENKKYWKVILYPWVCYYVNTSYDRWKIISNFQKLKKKNKFFVYKYNLQHNYLKILNLVDWHNKISLDPLNNFLFIEIIKFKNLKNIEIIKKKNNKIYSKPSQKLKYYFSNFFLIFDILLSKLGNRFNKLYIDKFYFPRLSFIKLCLKYFQIPAKNIYTFENSKINNDLNHPLRNLEIDKKLYNCKFEEFIYKKAFTFLPMSYLENYKKIIFQNQNITKKKLFIGMYSVHWNDEFKIYLAECLKKGSKYIHADHGAGLIGKYDYLHNHFYDISNKVIIQNRNCKRKKEIYLGPTIFKKKIKINNNKKLLINFHEPERYCFRVPLTTQHLDDHIENFKILVKSIKKLKPEIREQVKFRCKVIDGYNSELRFKFFFGSNCIENPKIENYTNSLIKSKLIICTIPQTSYTECLFQNIPVILVTHNIGYFDDQKKKKLLNIFLRNKLAFKNYFDAVKFINENWNNIDNWWNSYRIQNLRKYYLKLFYSVDKDFENKWFNFIKKEINF